MKVLIAEVNKDILKEILEVCVEDIRKIKFNPHSKHLCIFKLKNEDELQDVIEEIRRRGYNPYALISW